MPGSAAGPSVREPEEGKCGSPASYSRSATPHCVAACSDYRSGPKLQPRVKIDALIRDRAVNNGTRPRRTRPRKRPGTSLKATMELPRGASIPTRALEPWLTLGLLASSLWSGGLPQERAIDLGFVLIKGATEDATT
ncbi:hypothetical protein HaLaN_00873, partial [Haematococcus lacustris]